MRKAGTRIILLGLLLIAAALSLMGYNKWESWNAGKASAAALSILTENVVETMDAGFAKGQSTNPINMPETTAVPHTTLGSPEEEIPDFILNPEMEMPVRVADGYTYIAVLDMPTLGLQLPVMDRWDYERLKVAPCRYEGSAYTHDLVIAGHAYETHFYPLHNLNYGDVIYLTDMDGNLFEYEVAEMETLRETAIVDMIYSGYPLTLFTCTGGGNVVRLAVRCALVDVKHAS